MEVSLIEGIIEEEFADNNPIVSRTIEIEGHSSLKQLHKIIFSAFDREEDHLYEFHLGPESRFPNKRYVLEQLEEDEEEECGIIEHTTIHELHLEEGDAFGYLFDYGDLWIHQIEVKAILEQKDENVSYPRVSKKIGRSPPQYAEW